MQFQKPRTQRYGWLLALLVLQGGCGNPAELNRLPVFGTITGFPGTTGSISFIPAPGNKGPGAVASIQNGKYQFDATNGPTPGPHEVLISLTLGKHLPAGSSAAYNPKSTAPLRLKANVPAQSPFRLDFKFDDSMNSTPQP